MLGTMASSAVETPIVLSKLMKYYYDQGRYQIGPSVKMLKEVDQHRLVLSDMEVADEDIPVLCRFLSHKEVLKTIEVIEVNRTSGLSVNQRRCARDFSAFNSNKSLLFRKIIDFIARAENIKSISFEHVDVPKDLLSALGKAISSTKAEIRWLSFKSCNLSGDSGMRILTPYLGRMQLQVLALEHCSLTDKSLAYIASILKAQENLMDSLYWNATLRLNIDSSNHTAHSNKQHSKQPGEAKNNHHSRNGNGVGPDDRYHDVSLSQVNRDYLLERVADTHYIYSSGLVACSLYGNKFSSAGLLVLTRVLRKNSWLLGLNIANNSIDELGLAMLATELNANNALLALLVRGNPGFTPAGGVVSALYKEMSKKLQKEARDGISHDAGLSASIDQLHQNQHNDDFDVNDTIDATGTGGGSSGSIYYPRRLALLPVGVSQLLRRWMRLQQREALVHQQHDQNSQSPLNYSRSSRAFTSPNGRPGSALHVMSAPLAAAASSSAPAIASSGSFSPHTRVRAAASPGNRSRFSDTLNSSTVAGVMHLSITASNNVLYASSPSLRLRIAQPPAEDVGYSTISPMERKKPPTYMDSTFSRKSYHSNDISVSAGLKPGENGHKFNPYPESAELQSLTAAVMVGGDNECMGNALCLDDQDSQQSPDYQLQSHHRRNARPNNDHSSRGVNNVHGSRDDAFEFAVPSLSPGPSSNRKSRQRRNSDELDREEDDNDDVGTRRNATATTASVGVGPGTRSIFATGGAASSSAPNYEGSDTSTNEDSQSWDVVDWQQAGDDDHPIAEEEEDGNFANALETAGGVGGDETSGRPPSRISIRPVHSPSRDHYNERNHRPHNQQQQQRASHDDGHRALSSSSANNWAAPKMTTGPHTQPVGRPRSTIAPSGDHHARMSSAPVVENKKKVVGRATSFGHSYRQQSVRTTFDGSAIRAALSQSQSRSSSAQHDSRHDDNVHNSVNSAAYARYVSVHRGDAFERQNNYGHHRNESRLTDYSPKLRRKAAVPNNHNRSRSAGRSKGTKKRQESENAAASSAAAARVGSSATPTRIRARKSMQHTGDGAAGNTPNTGDGINVSQLSHLTESVLTATNTLEQVSMRLRDVTEALSESMNLSMNLQRGSYLGGQQAGDTSSLNISALMGNSSRIYNSNPHQQHGVSVFGSASKMSRDRGYADPLMGSNEFDNNEMAQFSNAEDWHRPVEKYQQAPQRSKSPDIMELTPSRVSRGAALLASAHSSTPSPAALNGGTGLLLSSPSASSAHRAAANWRSLDAVPSLSVPTTNNSFLAVSSGFPESSVETSFLSNRWPQKLNADNGNSTNANGQNGHRSHEAHVSLEEVDLADLIRTRMQAKLRNMLETTDYVDVSADANDNVVERGQAVDKRQQGGEDFDFMPNGFYAN